MTDMMVNDENDTEDDDVDTGEEGKFVIKVNGETVWTSVGEAMLVDNVKVSGARGEVTSIGSPGTDTYLNIVVNERSYNSPVTYLDMVEQEKRQERNEKYEPGMDREMEEGTYVQADPETGKPVEEESGIADSGDEESGKPWTTPEEPTEETGPTSATKDDENKGDLEF